MSPRGGFFHIDIAEVQTAEGIRVVDVIEDEAKVSQFVIADLEGAASRMVANPIGMADLV